MKLKKILKALGTFLIVTFVVAASAAIWGLTRLPSSSQIRQSMGGASVQKNPSEKNFAQKQNNSEHGSAVAPTISSDEVPNQTPPQDANEEAFMKLVTEDLMEPRRPLVQACRDLGEASHSSFIGKAEPSTTEDFLDALASDKKDPVVETVAPVLRYIFRAPGMSEVMHMIMEADADQAETLTQKAAFYSEMYKAAAFIKQHTSDLNSLLQKSYNMHILAKVVADRPQLANDNATRTFCEELENNLNAQTAVNADQQSEEMQKFLQDAGVDPKAVGFDPQYRAKVSTSFSNSSFTIDDPWLNQIFGQGEAMDDGEEAAPGDVGP